MSQPDASGGRSGMDVTPDETTVERMRAILEETRLGILQQILASNSGALSVEELAYRNTDLKAGTIDYHLRELEQRDVVTRLKADDPLNDIPSTYWAVTENGVALVKRLGFYDEIGVIAAADDALDRTDRIREIEAFGGRPEPDWY
jgi:DNA-binding transcriptional ArsR family regulator